MIRFAASSSRLLMLDKNRSDLLLWWMMTQQLQPEGNVKESLRTTAMFHKMYSQCRCTHAETSDEWKINMYNSHLDVWFWEIRFKYSYNFILNEPQRQTQVMFCAMDSLSQPLVLRRVIF